MAPTTSELQARIRELESRNVELEVRNVQLTKALASASTNGCDKFEVVNNFAHMIIDRHLEKISNIHHIAGTNEENDGVQELNNGVRLRPTFSIEDFIVIFDASTNTVDQK